MNETITVNEFGATIRKPYYIIEDGPEMKVTAEDLVRAIQAGDWLHWAFSLGWEHDANYSNAYEAELRAILYVANLITPTIDGAINGQPATFEVVYRAED